VTAELTLVEAVASPDAALREAVLVPALRRIGIACVGEAAALDAVRGVMRGSPTSAARLATAATAAIGWLASHGATLGAVRLETAILDELRAMDGSVEAARALIASLEAMGTWIDIAVAEEAVVRGRRLVADTGDDGDRLALTRALARAARVLREAAMTPPFDSDDPDDDPRIARAHALLDEAGVVLDGMPATVAVVERRVRLRCARAHLIHGTLGPTSAHGAWTLAREEVRAAVVATPALAELATQIEVILAAANDGPAERLAKAAAVVARRRGELAQDVADTLARGALVEALRRHAVYTRLADRAQAARIQAEALAVMRSIVDDEPTWPAHGRRYVELLVEAVKAGVQSQEIGDELVRVTTQLTEATEDRGQLIDAMCRGLDVQVTHARARGAHAEALAIALRGIELQRGRGDGAALLLPLCVVARIALDAGDVVAATRASDEAVELGRAGAGRVDHGAASLMASFVAKAKGRSAEAKRHLAEASVALLLGGGN
jgi:hypothetical protein